ncbi:MAG: hypothetical protein QG616_1980 [Pseudomonadota bacterium]|jgi:hypothetical protein|nr:hypothetical protein [Pseudomonadota bacterium]MDQ5960402.1 hypothetical protein [Pseudomonadota bacterium]
MNDIEINIRTGSRRRLDNGTIKWDAYRDDSHLITYGLDTKAAIREALFQVERMLREALGVESMQ